MLARHFYALMASTRIFSGDVTPPAGENLTYDYEFGKTVVGAWGLRRIVSGYSGNVIRVRPPAGGAEFDVGLDSNGKLDLTAPTAGDHGAHTYWRIKPLEGMHSNYVVIADLEMYETEEPGTNVATGGTATASSQFGSQAPSGAFDGNPATAWESNNVQLSLGTTWLAYQFPTPRNIKSIKVTCSNYEDDERPYRGVMEYSDDGVTWTRAFQWGPFWWTGVSPESFTAKKQPTDKYYVTRIYDQSGNGAYLQQTDPFKQPILHLTGAPNGGPYIEFDGYDDYLADNTFSTTRPYMIADPFVVYMGGQTESRRLNGKPWIIPQEAAAVTSPYMRLGVEISEESRNYTDVYHFRVNGTEQRNRYMMCATNIRGWYGHAVCPSLGMLLQMGFTDQSIPTSATITYPSATGLHLGATAQGLENNGGKFIEIAIMQAATLVQASVQNALNRIAYNAMLGANTLYKMVLDRMFSTSTTDGGFAEVELRNGASGPDLTSPLGPVMVNKRDSSATDGRHTIDNNNATAWYSFSVPAVKPEISWLIDTPGTLVNEVMLRAESGTPNRTPDKWTLHRFTRDGWQAAPQIDMSADGNSSGQVYVKSIAWPADGSGSSYISKLNRLVIFKKVQPTVFKISKYTIFKAV